MERRDEDVRTYIQIEKLSFDATNFCHAWQKNQKTALILRERAPDCLYDCHIEMAGERLVEVACLHRKEPAVAGDYGRPAQEIRDRSTVQRGRHHE